MISCTRDGKQTLIKKVMNVEVKRFGEVLLAFKPHKPQMIIQAHDPKRLRFGWFIDDPKILVTVRMADAKRYWPEEVYELVSTGKSNGLLMKAMRKAIWGKK